MTGDPLIDVAQAIKTKWDATPAITSAVPGGLHEGPLDAASAVVAPWATLSVKQGPRENLYSSSGDWIDYEEVTITIYGIGFKATGDVVGICKTGLETGTLTVPNGIWMRTEVLPGWTNEKDADGKKSGQDHRKATLRYCVWSHRRA
jgi:hypothetical protein